ncbi:mxaC protein [Filomicrobium insigne]|uniref:MxaC protein n=1 Tax=Filomicrobium insigne TaxID=418854 RepID=A0A1H0T243_9HYPH|nr:vWA domain-containing protein [Filomicrobium insigne]SDP47646.1 mxaC protein [Filomicrobium insigne]
MNLAFAHPLFLLALPLALVPLVWLSQRTHDYASLDFMDPDWLSTAVDWGLRALLSLSLLGLVLGLAGLHVRGTSIERVGTGAHIVLLIDRSSSMDQTFAGRQPTGDEMSKSTAARVLLEDFIQKRAHDRFGVAAFSTAPFLVLPITDHKEAVLAAIRAIDRPGLAFTDVGRGLALSLATHEADPAAASRAIVLVSDGAAVIDRKVQELLRQGFSKRRINLYWLYLRTEGSRGIYEEPRQGEEDTPQALPERHLHKFFLTLGAPYRAFEADNPQSVADAIAEIDKLEREPIRYVERVPQTDLAHWAYAIAAVCLAILLLAKLCEVGIARTWKGANV